MKLKEIFLNSTNQREPGFSLNDWNTENATLVTRAENLPVYMIKPKQESQLVAYAIKKDNQFVSFVIGTHQSVHGTKYFMIGRSYTLPTHEKQGLSSALYTALVTKKHLVLMSDNEQGPGSKRVWDKISKVLHTQVLNLKTGEKLSRDKIPDDQIYQQDPNHPNAKNLVIVTEQYVNNIIDDVRSQNENLLGDYVIYTHPDVHGVYD